MTRTVFNNLKKLKYAGIPLPKFASWAIWDKKIKEKNGDIPEIVEKNVGKLKGNIVFVGLNFGKKKEDCKKWKDWQNFHGVKRLIDLLSKPRFKGAYMTDIIKNYHETKSEKLMSHLNEKLINKNIEFFFKEIESLKANNIEMYLFGGAVESIFVKHLMRHKDFCSFRQKVIKCRRISHYSGRVSDFNKKAYVQLGIKKQISAAEKKWKYKPLWDSTARCSPQR
jgi:hypothetical protein